MSVVAIDITNFAKDVSAHVAQDVGGLCAED